MSAPQALADALLELVPGSLELHDGQVPDKPTYPYVVASIVVPTVAARAMSGDAHGLLVRAQFTVVAGTASGVRIVVGILNDALDGAWPYADGYSVGRLALGNARKTAEDPSVVIQETGLHPMFAVLEYTFTASPLAPVA